ncbi:MAG: cysteine dioxygenase family protein [Rhodospirillales bacterium]|nr:cysteine dioxygenase family protein [Rhodospirillales bacterium]
MNATDIRAARAAAVQATMGRIRAIEASDGVTRASLAKIEALLQALARQEHLFPTAAFPPPPQGQKGANRYLLETQPDGRFALYLNALNPGNETRPHDHTTWAVVVAVEGQELNKVYRREPGRLVVDHEIMVEPGRGIAMMPDDIHSIHTTGAVPTRHLHCYGLALEQLERRMAYDENGEALPYNRNFMQPSLAPRD